MSTKVITGTVRLSYANLFEPRAVEEGQEPKYGASILIPKSDTETLTAVRAAIKEAVELGKSTKFGGKATGLKNPLRDGDEDRPDDDTYAGHYFINANSKRQPVLLDVDGSETDSEDKLYSGVYARVSLNFFPFAVSGNKGVAAGLNSVIRVKDGEPLGSVVTAASAAADFGVTPPKSSAKKAAAEFDSGSPDEGADAGDADGGSEDPWES